MDWGSPFVWLPVLAVGIGLVIGIRIYSSRTRKRDFVAYGGTLGFRPVCTRKPLSPAERKVFPLFRTGMSGRFCHVMEHRSGALLFDYRYRFGLPLIASVIYHQTIAAFHVVTNGIPDFCLSPATSVDKLGMKLGVSNIAIESVPEFSARYFLRGENSASIASLFTNIATEWMAMDASADLSVEKGGPWIIVYRQGRLISPQSFRAFLDEAIAIKGLVSRRITDGTVCQSHRDGC